jgi:hypothetical protein
MIGSWRSVGSRRFPCSSSSRARHRRTRNKNKWVFFDLQGTTSNRDGVGAKVVVTAGGITRARELKGGGGGTPPHGNSHLLHFGLGQATAIDKVTVRWVGGATETFVGVTPNGRFKLVQGTGTATPR